MLNEKVLNALNAQINAELYSSYLYLSMSAWFETKDLPGMATWMKVQALEELTHADRFYKYINEKDGTVTVTAIEGPPTSWNSPEEAFMAAHEHEHKVSDLINKLVDLSLEVKDHATNNFLQWFVNEQIEEESSTWEAVRKLKMIGNDGAGLYMVDKEFGARTFVMPAPAGEAGA